MPKGKKEKVYVGLSGGVDSSVAAGLLKRQGFEVVGVFIRVWSPFDDAQGKPSDSSTGSLPQDKSDTLCDWRAERREARRVAAHLDIPLLTLDLRREYKKKVVDYFLAEYRAGRTPNPDVMCNKQIKFGAFFAWALTQGADFVATGHYAQIKNEELRISADQDKDQTYFLWPIKKEQLNEILFPVGGYTKPAVRKLARKFGLPNAEKKDSQGLCFVGPIDFKAFLKQQLKEKPGNVLNESGEVIGRHSGAIFFTLGERHGFEVFKQSSDTKPYYVITKDIKTNTLTVSNQPQSIDFNLKQEIKLTNVNWLGNAPSEIKLPYRCRARVRYRQPLQACRLVSLDLAKKTATVIFTKRQPQPATPGQSLVLYDKNVCLGGGVII